METKHPLVHAEEDAATEAAQWFYVALSDFDHAIHSKHFFWVFGVLWETLAVCWLYLKYKLYEAILLACLQLDAWGKAAYITSV